MVELLNKMPEQTMEFSQLIPSYHQHFKVQCRLADYGCTKLVDLLDSIPHVLKVHIDYWQCGLTMRISMKKESQGMKTITLGEHKKFWSHIKPKSSVWTAYMSKISLSLQSRGIKFSIKFKHLHSSLYTCMTVQNE